MNAEAAGTEGMMEVLVAAFDTDTLSSQFLHMRSPATSGATILFF